MKELKDYAESERKSFHGFYITIDGRLFDMEDSVEVRPKHPYLIYYEKDKQRKRYLGIIVYELFSGKKMSRKEILKYKDGNPMNFSYDNIFLIPKTGNCTIFYRFSEEEVNAIREEYFRGTEQRKKGNYNKEDFLSYAKLAKKYQCSKTTIQKILNGTYYGEN